jgi:outer membrane protein assembly factor BamB
VPFLEMGQVFFPKESNATESSAKSWPKDRTASFYTGVRALDALTGNLEWEYRFEPRTTEPFTGGLVSTETGLVFGSDLGKVFALDSRTGKQLWTFATGGEVYAAPVTYMYEGQQFLAVASGNTFLGFALPKTRGND